MLPRKRQRPNPAAGVSISLPTATVDDATTSRHASMSRTPSKTSSQLGSQPPLSTPQSIPPMSKSLSIDHKSSSPSDSVSQKQVRKTKSWYGPWPKPPQKASASTLVARENILGGTVRSTGTPDLSRFDSSKRTATTESASIRSSSQSVSLPKVPEDSGSVTTIAALDGVADDTADGKKETGSQPLQTAEDIKGTAQEVSVPALQLPARNLAPAQEGVAPGAGWLGWWSKAPTKEQPSISSPANTEHIIQSATDSIPIPSPRQVAPPDTVARELPSSAPTASSPWFGFWSSTPVEKMKKTELEKGDNAEESPRKTQEDVVMQDTRASEPEQESASAPAPTAGSTWAFWSRATPSTASNKGSVSESGEMAIMGEGSEAQPERMSETDVSGQPKKTSKQVVSSKDEQSQMRSTWGRKKRVRPPSIDGPVESGTSTPARAATPVINEPQGLPIPPREPQTHVPSTKAESSNKPIAESETPMKQPPNLLLPSFSSTYRMKDDPSILQKITQLLLRTSQPAVSHVFLTKEPPKIRKAIAIGIHGLFPATYLRPMIGQPTGTSLRFANLCAEAIRRWTDSHGSQDCDIEKVALEGEGRISDRVDNLWKLMLNWIDHIRKADLIVMACHSQGVPVAIMLLEKLIDLGIITNAKIGVCAMAGVALGPFPDYKSSIFMGSAAELWEFGNPQSSNSQRFETALKRVLAYGARVTFIGSIDDQVVPMESAVYSPASHPYIYRAVFIDGRIHAPDFISHLVGFALKLRNLGVTDHGLVRELSIALAGSLYSGEGHSRLYYEPAVYDLAIKHALETTSTPKPVECEVRSSQGLSSTNPYVLPWIMRGMLEDDFVKTELGSETEELLRQFDDWKPTSKALKDVKYRLEAVRSRL